MSTANHPSLLSTAKTNWAYFLPMWIFPLAFLAMGAVGLLSQVTFTLIVMPLFFLSFFRAITPWRRKTAGYWHTAFWAILVPLIIWAVAVFGIGSLSQALG